MAAKGQSGPDTLGNLFEGFFFEVPSYQRYYSWSEEQLWDLWTDLQTLPPEKDHYFGTVILQETPDSDNREPQRVMAEEQKKHFIIDGQQRITTISILFKVMLNKLQDAVEQLEQPEEWKESLENIERKWLIDEDLYRLNLQKGDLDFFHNYVIENQEHVEPETPSEVKIAEAKEFFEERFESMQESASPSVFVEECDNLRKQISSLELMIHYVGANNDEQATRIFESENDRGKQLSLLERTKSFLMYMTYRSAEEDDGSFERTITKIQSSFARIYRHMQEIEQAERDSLSEDAVQRYHYISYASWSNKKEYQGESLLDNLKAKIRNEHAEDREACLNAIEDYTKSLELGFQNIEKILTYDRKNEVTSRLKQIYTLGNVARFYPLLILLWDGYDDDTKSLGSVLEIIETAIVRLYAIGGHPSHAKRPQIHKIARDTSSETPIDTWRRRISDTVADFKDDDSFRRVLKSQSFYENQSSKQIRFLLYFYEKQLCERAGEPDAIEFETVIGSGTEVEHIWPQSPEEYPIDQEEYDSLKHRLGNLTFVSDEYNKKELQNKLFDKKGPAFATSSYRLNREKIAKSGRWGKEEITSREDDNLIPFILERWSLA
jgi:uncharacterized protein with ParB-like and HNH nuclease domain